MSNITVKFEPVGFQEVSQKVSRNIAFSCVQGINDTLKDIQKRERIELAQELMLRTPASKKFLENQVAKISFATLNSQAKGGARAYGEVYINRIGGGGKKGGVLLLNALAVGGVEREPSKGSVIAQPITGSPARPSAGSSIAKSLTFTQMKLKKVKTAKGSGAGSGDAGYKGKNGTFTIAGSGVYQRIGSGKNDIRMIYDYRDRQVIGKELDWYDVANQVIERQLMNNILSRYNAKK